MPVNRLMQSILLSMAFAMMNCSHMHSTNRGIASSVDLIQSSNSDIKGFGTQWSLINPKVVIVSTLKKSGPGSLQAALALKGPRIIEFSVSGEIEVDKLEIRSSFVIVNGASAPQSGITIVGGIRIIGASYVLLQNLRIHDPGDFKRRDGVKIVDNSHHVIIDNCSVIGHRDNSVDLGDDIHHVTIQRTILQSFAPHAHGINSGKDNNNHSFSIHHNLLAHHNGHYPLVGGPTSIADIRNNVSYNYSEGGTKIIAGAKVNVINNVYLAGPTTALEKSYLKVDNAHAFISGNIAPLTKKTPPVSNVTMPFLAPTVGTEPTSSLVSKLLSYVGAKPRSEYDNKLVGEVQRGEGWHGLPSSEFFFSRRFSTKSRKKGEFKFFKPRDDEFADDVRVNLDIQQKTLNIVIEGPMPNVPKLASLQGVPRDAWPDDGHGRHVELHLTPNWSDTRDRFMFIVTAKNGTRFDAKNFEGSWNGTWEASSEKISGNRWRVNFRIPLVTFGKKNLKEPIGLQIIYYQDEDEERVFPALEYNGKFFGRYLGPTTDFAKVFLY